MDNAKNSACKSGVGNEWPEGFTCEMCGKTLCDMQKLDRVSSYLQPHFKDLALMRSSIFVVVN
jgi:hypothetical protein